MDFGYFGCQADVKYILDARCTGNQRCSLPIPDDDIEATKPCTKGLVTYLEASYTCIPGKSLIGTICFLLDNNTNYCIAGMKVQRLVFIMRVFKGM